MRGDGWSSFQIRRCCSLKSSTAADTAVRYASGSSSGGRRPAALSSAAAPPQSTASSQSKRVRKTVWRGFIWGGGGGTCPSPFPGGLGPGPGAAADAPLHPGRVHVVVPHLQYATQGATTGHHVTSRHTDTDRHGSNKGCHGSACICSGELGACRTAGRHTCVVRLKGMQ